MNVRDIVISEFTRVFAIGGVRLNERVIKIAESPFNLNAVQSFIDNDIEKVRREYQGSSVFLQNDAIKKREAMHEDRLRNLSRQYALRIVGYIRNNPYYLILATESILNESIASNEQRNLKYEASRACDIYPCEN